MVPAILAALLPVVGKVVERIAPNQDERNRLEAELTRELLANASQIEQAAAKVVMAEIQGEGWLQRSWRPITMLTFLACVVGYWFGLTPPLPVTAVDSMFQLVQIGLGGYVVGRSAEKVAERVAPALGGKHG